MKYINYSIAEILDKWNKGIRTEELEDIYARVEEYRISQEALVQKCLNTINFINPENKMRWIQENVSLDIRRYVVCHVLGKEYNVLMRSERKWKTLSDIGFDVEHQGNSREREDKYFSIWIEEAGAIRDSGLPIFETHAHYNLKNYNGVREKLVNLIHEAGIQEIVSPAVDYSTNHQMIDMFDKPEYYFFKFAFGSHPKYLWKEDWSEARWKEFEQLLLNTKCVAVGETGLDYSYDGFCEDHRIKQKYMFDRFITIANKHQLPVVLHLRPSDDGLLAVDEDAYAIMMSNKIQHGAVYHCFGGSIDDVEKSMEVGITHFGIGGRLFYDNDELTNAVKLMPEETILLETDAPYIKIDNLSAPNTSLSLFAIAKKIAEIRNTSVEHILKVTYTNALKLFNKN